MSVIQSQGNKLNLNAAFAALNTGDKYFRFKRFVPRHTPVTRAVAVRAPADAP